MSGSLREDLYKKLLEWESKCDLCIAMGTSLAGMNADRLPESASTRGQGTVIINLQKTSMDDLSSLRIFARVDQVAELIMNKLNLTLDESQNIPSENSFLIPYNTESDGSKTLNHNRLELSEGTRIRITDGMYKDDEGVIMSRTNEGHWRLQVRHRVKGKFYATVPLILGYWWVNAALSGEIEVLPLVNVK